MGRLVLAAVFCLLPLPVRRRPVFSPMLSLLPWPSLLLPVALPLSVPPPCVGTAASVLAIADIVCVVVAAVVVIASVAIGAAAMIVAAAAIDVVDVGVVIVAAIVGVVITYGCCRQRPTPTLLWLMVGYVPPWCFMVVGGSSWLLTAVDSW